MSPRRVLEEHSSRELSEWQGYFMAEDMRTKMRESTDATVRRALKR